MSEIPGDRPRPTPRPRPAAAPRPTPRPRVAGSRRDRDADPAADPAATATAVRTDHATDEATGDATGVSMAPAARRSRRPRAAADPVPARRRGGPRLLVLGLAVLCALAGAGGGLLLWQRLHPSYVDASLFSAARSGVQDLYAYDYKDSKGSIARKLAVLTGDLHDQYQKDLSQGGIVDTYQQVSATTSFDVVDVGLVQVDDAQDAATLVVFGQYRVKSVNSGSQPAPQGSECTVTTDGAQSCTQTVQLHEVKVHGAWKIDQLVLKTTT